MQKRGQAMLYLHDVFLRAAWSHLDVFILCGALKSDWEEQYGKTGRGVSDSFREVLAAGQNISLIVWSEADRDAVPAWMQALAEECERREDWGTLEIRVSGTSEGHIAHFTIAKSRDDRKWIVRVEEPHAIASDRAGLASEHPAVIMFGTEEAASVGKKLLTLFESIIRAESHAG